MTAKPPELPRMAQLARVSGYVYRLTMLRTAAFDPPESCPHAGAEPEPYEPGVDALLRRLAERLPDELTADVVELIKLARESP